MGVEQGGAWAGRCPDQVGRRLDKLKPLLDALGYPRMFGQLGAPVPAFGAALSLGERRRIRSKRIAATALTLRRRPA